MCATAFWTSSGSFGFSQPPEIHQLQNLWGPKHNVPTTLSGNMKNHSGFGRGEVSQPMVRAFGKKKEMLCRSYFFSVTSCVPLSHCRAQDAVASASSPINYDREEWQWLRTQFDDKDALCWSQEEDDLSTEGRMKRGAYLSFWRRTTAKDRFPNMATKSGQWRGSLAPSQSWKELTTGCVRTGSAWWPPASPLGIGFTQRQ